MADVIGNVNAPYLVVKGLKVGEYYTKEKFLVRGEMDG